MTRRRTPSRPKKKKPAKPRGKAGSEEKRKQIRRAAYRCFTRGGYHETTVDTICEELGISKGSFYWHFKGKQEVFLDILDNWARDVETQMARQYHGALADDNPFVAMTRALQEESERGGQFIPVWLEFVSQVGHVPEVRKALSRFHGRIRKSVDEMLKPILPRAFSAKDRRALSSVILAIFIGLMAQEMVDPKKVEFKDTIRRFMAALRFYVERAYDGEDPPSDPT
jgi:AcrR family transcriptional regulator